MPLDQKLAQRLKAAENLTHKHERIRRHASASCGAICVYSAGCEGLDFAEKSQPQCSLRRCTTISCRFVFNIFWTYAEWPSSLMCVCVSVTVTRGWISNYARDGLFYFLMGVNETKKKSLWTVCSAWSDVPGNINNNDSCWHSYLVSETSHWLCPGHMDMRVWSHYVIYNTKLIQAWGKSLQEQGYLKWKQMNNFLSIAQMNAGH